MGEIKSYHDLEQYNDILEVIQRIEAKVHGGLYHHAHLRTRVMGDGDTCEMYFKTPDTTIRCAAIISFSAELAAWASIRESATVSLSGSVLTAYNANRNLSSTALAIVRSSPTITASGNRIEALDFGGGKQGQTGGDATSRIPWVLKQGTVYIFRVTSLAAANSGVIEVGWCECES